MAIDEVDPPMGTHPTNVAAQSGLTAGSVILDNVGNHSLAATRGALTPDGTVQPNGGGHSAGRWIGSMGGVIKTALSSKIERRQLGPSIKTQNGKDLAALKALVEAGKVTPVIDSTYPLSRTPEALRHVGEGHARGTVVITVC